MAAEGQIARPAAKGSGDVLDYRICTAFSGRLEGSGIASPRAECFSDECPFLWVERRSLCWWHTKTQCYRVGRCDRR